MKLVGAALSGVVFACAGAMASALAAPEALTNVAPDHPLIGEWAGQATSEGASAGVAFRFERQDDGSLVAFFSLPQTNIVDAKLGPVKQEEGVFRFYDFHMELDASGTRLTGYLPFYARRLEMEATKGARLPVIPETQPSGKEPTPAWTFPAGAPLWSSPAVRGDRVYFGSHDGKLHVLEAKSGRPAWTFEAGGAIVARPTFDARALYFPSDDGHLYKLDLQGRQVWRFDMQGAGVARELPGIRKYAYDYFASSATLAGDSLYIGSPDGHLYALDPQTGAQRWRFKTGGIIRSTPVVSQGRVLFGSRDGLVYALDAKSGALRWKRATGDVVNSSPALVGDTVVIGSRNTDIYALNVETGAARWKYFYWMSWVESSAVLRDRMLYIGSSDYQRLYALDAHSGRELWWYDTAGSSWSTPAVTADAVYIGVVGTTGYSMDHRGGFRAVDRKSGREKWRMTFRPAEGQFTHGVASSPAVAHGLVFFGGLEGTFYAVAQ
jgi:outer membrane protein assembly factor BamB